MSYTDDLILNSIKKSRDGIEGEPDALMKAMNKAGLVQKEVQVRGKNGQIFTRKQWVKAGEDQSSQKPVGKSDNNSSKPDKESLEEIEKILEKEKDKLKSYNDALRATNSDSRMIELSALINESKKRIKQLESKLSVPSTRKELVNKVEQLYMELDDEEADNIIDQYGASDGDNFTSSMSDDNLKNAFLKLNRLKQSKQETSQKGQPVKKPTEKQDEKSVHQSEQEIDFGNRDKQSLVSLLQSGKSREDIMAAAEKQGITWKKSDHAGVNWMRCSMAITGTTTKGSKKEDVTQQKKPEESASKTNDTDTSKDNSSAKSDSSVIGKDYHSLTTDEEAKTPAGEAHNMMVGALKSRGMLPKTGQIKPDSKPINTIAKELRRRQISSAIKATQKSEETRALQVAKELDKIAGYSSPYGLDNIEVVLKNCLTEDSSTQEERVSALAKLMGKDYVPYSSEAVRTSADTIDGTVSVGIVPKIGGYFDATFTYADGSSRSETYDSISAVKTASDKFVKNEVDFVERMNKSTMSEIEKGNTYSFAKMFAKKYPDETAEIGLDPQNNYRALINYSEEDKIFTVYRKNGDKDFFDNKMNYLGRKLY